MSATSSNTASPATGFEPLAFSTTHDEVRHVVIDWTISVEEWVATLDREQKQKWNAMTQEQRQKAWQLFKERSRFKQGELIEMDEWEEAWTDEVATDEAPGNDTVLGLATSANASVWAAVHRELQCASVPLQGPRPDQLEDVSEAGSDSGDSGDSDDSSDEGSDSDNTDSQLAAAIETVFTDLQAMGIRCEAEWECCQSCGHEALEDCTDYVFYHEQTAGSIKKGEKEARLAYSLEDEAKAKVLENIAHSPFLMWSGDERDTMYVSADAECRMAQTKQMAERKAMWAAKDAASAAT